MNHPHLKKNSHFACKEIIESHKKGGYPCCKCNNHDCMEEVEVECTCHKEVEKVLTDLEATPLIEMVELTGDEARKFIEGFTEAMMADKKCGCGLHAEHTGKHAPDIEKERPTRPETGHTMEEGAVIGCPWCCYLAEIKGKLHS